jgi:oxygen-independent coproporphyrinogen-3 oxidase
MTTSSTTPSALRGLIEKYSVAGPRYTSYPTAPQWADLGEEKYQQALQAGYLGDDDPLALYVHIPFCEKLCYYCGCNIQITKDHGRSPSYVDALLAEAKFVSARLGGRKTLSQISWGGGTPTFLNTDEIARLHRGIAASFDISPSAEVSIEVDPRVTSCAQLEILRTLGFNHVSMGVQDFEPQVQKAINREQSREMTEQMLKKCRELGFTGINFDLIYGLPHQSLATFERTITQVAQVRPDRIALYNYARIPSLLKHQTILEEYPMPSAEERVEIFSMAYDRLTAAGYRAIGMDHFALEDDELYRAIEKGTLYRNFMGYSVKRGKNMIGLGASAIGEVGPTFFQNLRKPQDYQAAVESGKLAAFRGCFLSADDLRRKWVIQEIMCRFVLDYATFDTQFNEKFETYFAEELPRLAPFFSDGILVAGERSVRVTDLGRIFIRNVAMVFDAYLKQPGKAAHSKTV